MPGRIERLPDDALLELLPAGRRRRFRPGETVCRQGERAAALHVLLAGRATVSLVLSSGELTALGVLVAGEVFGEAAVLHTDAVYPASLIAAEALETLAIEPEEFRAVQAERPILAQAVLSVLAGRVLGLTENLVEALYLPAESRVLRRLLSLAAVYGDGSPGTVIPINQSDLAALAGVARATVNRALRRQEVGGSLKLGRGRIIILEPEALAARAGTSLLRSSPIARSVDAEVAEERRVVTVLLVDTARPATAGADPEDLGRVQAAQVARLTRVLERHGGRVEEGWGGRLMAVFGAPAALGGDALNAVRAAQAARAEPAVRIGVQTGEALVRAPGEARWLVGAVVDEAVRLQEAAPEGGVMVGEETYRATRRTARYATATGGWLLQEVSPPATAALSKLVGRQRELDFLRSEWKRVVAERRPRLVTLLGPPGIGKTRLAAELARLVTAESGTVLWGRSLPYGEGTGYGAFVEQVKAAAGITESDTQPEAVDKLSACVSEVVARDEAEGVTRDLSLLLGADSERPADRQSLFVSARRLVTGLGRRRPTLLIFEDVHWSEAMLLDLVEWLGGRIFDSAVLILTMARPELLDSRATWAGGLPNASSVELDVLSEAGAGRLASQLLPAGRQAASLRRRLVEVSGGNPLFLEELAAAMSEAPRVAADSLPTTLITTISARLDALPPASRALLFDASVVGKTFWRGALQRMGRHSDLDELLEMIEAKGFARREVTSQLDGDREYTFKHMLIREVAYATISRAARQQRHAQVARFLEAVVKDRVGERASLLAHHWREAGERERALRYLIEAADRAAGLAAHREAATLLTEAIQLVDARGEGATQGDLRGRRGIQRSRIGEWALARPDLEAAYEQLPAREVDRKIKLLIELALVSYWLFDSRATRKYASEAMRLADEAGRAELKAGSIGILGWADSSDGDIAASIEHFDVALKRPSGIPAELLGPTVELSALTLYWLGRGNEAVLRAQQALEIARDAKDTNTTIRTLGNLVLALASAGRYAEAHAAFAEARRFGEEFGTGPFLARAVAIFGGVHLALGDLAGAEALAEEAAGLARTHKFQLAAVSSGIDLMLNFARRGEPERAERMASAVAESVRTAQGSHGWLWRLRFASATAELAAARGRWAEAAKSAEEALARARVSGRVKYEAAATSVLARVSAEEGRPDQAAALARSTVALARATGDPALLLRALTSVLEFADDAQVRAEISDVRARIASGLPEGKLRRAFAG